MNFQGSNSKALWKDFKLRIYYAIGSYQEEVLFFWDIIKHFSGYLIMESKSILSCHYKIKINKFFSTYISQPED